MNKKNKKDEALWDLKFWLFFLCGFMAGYLLLRDRFVSVSSIWNGYLWLLLGPFIFGVIYKLEYFAISFWLLLALSATDLIMGIDLNVAGGPSCWSGFAVWVMIIVAGFAGSIISLFIPQDNPFFENLNRGA
jgi:hypothetical protein